MATPQFVCKSCQMDIYDYAHLHEHRCMHGNFCEVEEYQRAIVDTPERSQFDPNSY